MVSISVQFADDQESHPEIDDFKRWAAAVANSDDRQQEVSLRIVNKQEMQKLNSRFRKKESATNVLSFPAELHDEVDIPFLGDVIICAPIVNNEAAEQGKSAIGHWAHMTVHGILHLQGYDHTKDADAAEMEKLEIDILSNLGFSNPYI